MWIVRLALARPYTFVVLALLLFLIAPFAILSTPIDIFPAINVPVVSIIWSYTGLVPSEMETRITSIYERALTSTVSNIEHIESQSLNGVSVTKVFLRPQGNVDGAIAEVLAEAQSVLKLLPPGINPPLVIRYDASTVPILELGLSGKGMSEQQLNDLGNNFIRPQLATVQGAAVPIPYGGKVRQIMVDIDSQKLISKGLSATDVVNAVNAQNVILPSGTAKIGATEYNVGLNGSPTTVDGLNDLPVKSVNGATIYMRDIAHVRDGFAVQQNVVRQDGQRGVLLTIEKAGNASTLAIVAAIRAQLPLLKGSLPPELVIKTLLDQSLFVRASLVGVVREGLIAGALTSILILVFLGSWRSTLVIATSIPLSILTSVLIMSALGETINIMTLGGLALAVGILVDDATVEIENTQRQLATGKDLTNAILDSAEQIAAPAFVSTVCISIVFVPMFFLKGVAHFLFVPLAEAVVFALIASYFFSRTIVPTMVHYLLPKEVEQKRNPDKNSKPNWFARLHARFELAFERFEHGYASVLQLCLDRRVLFSAVFLAFCLASTALFPFLGNDFFPTVDAGQFQLHVRAKTGTRIEETARLVDQIERSIRAKIPPSEVSGILDNIGLPTSGINLSYSNSGIIGSADALILGSLSPTHHPTAGYVEQLRRQLPREFPGTSFFFEPADIVSQTLNFGLPSPIDVQIVGHNQAGNFAAASAMQEQIRAIPGAVDVHIQQQFDQPRLQYDVDRVRAQQVGLSTRDVSSSLLVSLSSSFQTAPNLWLNPKNGVSYSVAVQTPQYRIASLDDVGSIPVTASSTAATTAVSAPGMTPYTPPGSSSMTIPGTSSGATTASPQLFENLTTMHPMQEPAVASHYNVQPVVDIYGSVQGTDLGSVGTAVDRITRDAIKHLPAGSHLVVRGQLATMQTSFLGLYIGIGVAIVLVYLLLVVNFQSWSEAFIIITALPGAMAGICWILFLTHTTLSVPALMGAIMSIGVATSNSVLVITFANERFAETSNAFNAALEAGHTRLRPVIMTATAMIIGMVPMALGLGEGGEQNAPLGRAVIGGLLFATIATLFFVPTVFALIRSRQKPAPQDPDQARIDGKDPQNNKPQTKNAAPSATPEPSHA